jgi:hypothetical protein
VRTSKFDFDTQPVGDVWKSTGVWTWSFPPWIAQTDEAIEIADKRTIDSSSPPQLLQMWCLNQGNCLNEINVCFYFRASDWLSICGLVKYQPNHVLLADAAALVFFVVSATRVTFKSMTKNGWEQIFPTGLDYSSN